MDKGLIRLYVKTYLLSKGISCSGLSELEMFGIVAHVGEPSVSLKEWLATMNEETAPEPEEEVTEDMVDDELNNMHNQQFFAAAMGAKDLHDKGILKVEKVS